MKRLTPILLTAALTSLFLACEKKVGKGPVATTPVTVNACDTITYQKHIKPIVDSKCIACHAPSGTGPDYTVYENLKSRALNGVLKTRVLDQKNMPPSGNPQPTQEQLNLIQCWINNGAKEK